MTVDGADAFMQDRQRRTNAAVQLEEKNDVLYDMTSGALEAVAPTTFAQEKVMERQHLQAALRKNIDVLGENLLVVAEEFGAFEEANRRIDLLCVDRSARLVVVELKRTLGGGHMELQAIRYAAMVSVMTFDELVWTYAQHLAVAPNDEPDVDEARANLLDWLDDVDEDEPVIPREVGIILASADFSPEITTTVLWLNEFYGMDIRCVRLSPYKHGERLLLDVQQIVPLPEAEELTVRLKKRDAAAKKAKTSGGTKDLTKFVVTTPGHSTEPLPKRRAVLAMVHALHQAGVPAATLAKTMPPSKMRAVKGPLDGDALWLALVADHGLAAQRRRGWFVDEPVHEGEVSWVVSKAWGSRTVKVLEALGELAPEGYSCKPVD